MRIPGEYGPETYIKCVLVGGECHGRMYARSPEDAFEFKMAKIPPVNLSRGFKEFELSVGMDPIETIRYEPFLEMSSRDGFVRFFRVRDYYTTENTSFLQIADALRIAGIDHA